jgi:hypothetical protein
MKNGKEPNFYYIYIITNLILNKQYIGSRMCYKDDPNNDDYWGSSKYLNEDYKIYGKENFTKEIITSDYKNIKDMLEGETKFILEYNTLEPNGYNRYLPNRYPNFYTGNCVVSKETREKQRQAKIGKKRSLESRKKTSDTMQKNGSKKKEKHHMWKKTLSESHKKALVTSRIGKKTVYSPESRKKMSYSAKHRKSPSNYKPIPEEQQNYIKKRFLEDKISFSRIAIELNIHKGRIKRFLQKEGIIT